MVKIKMELNILEESKNKIIFEMIGEDHTFSNALREELWNDKDVKSAGYNIKHPLISSPRFILETTKNDPKKTLKDAVKRIKERNDEFLNVFNKAK
jgi:DNA-directed RNA polymerase subunit L